jgi:hypothetical protein
MKDHLHRSYRAFLVATFIFSSMAARADYGREIRVDRDGNVIVAGDTFEGAVPRENLLILKYSGAGVPLWTNRFYAPTNSNYEVSGLAVDNRGNVFVAGAAGSGAHYLTIAYSAAGAALWTNLYDNPNRIDVARALAVDTNGNVFVTGSSSQNGGSGDCVTIAYSGAGVALWTNRFGPSGGVAIAVDARGNVIVAGGSYNGASYDYMTVAYAASGAALWTNRYDAGGFSDDFPSAVAVDHSGNVFVTGYSGGYDYATIAYSPAGRAFWTNRFNGWANSEDVAREVAVDHNGNVFVTGFSDSLNVPQQQDRDYATVAYSGAGVALWTNRHAGSGHALDWPHGVAVDDSGNVVVSGVSIASTADYVTIKYSGAGVALWTNRFDGSTNGSEDGAFDVAVDSDGNIFVTGISSGTLGADCATVAYSTAGVPLWTNRYNGRLRQPQVTIQPLTAGSSTVNLNLSGPADSPWNIQRALTIAGPWTNLGPSLIGTNGAVSFLDGNPPSQGAFYRVVPP